MNIVRRENAFDQLHREMNQLFRSRLLSDDDASDVVTSRWAPSVDILEEEKAFVLKADLPGIDPKDIDITMENSVLSIKGERLNEKREQGQSGRYQRVERAYGVFHRRFALPETADSDGIRAEGRNGVLIITIPKQEKAQSRRIAVAH